LDAGVQPRVGEVVAQQAEDGLGAGLGHARGHAAEHGEHVAVHAAGVGHLAGEHGLVASLDGVDELGLVVPRAVEHGPAGAGPVGDGFHGHAGVTGGL
jgi:hypothetical protein